METGGLLLLSRELATVPRPVADKSIPNPHPIQLTAIFGTFLISLFVLLIPFISQTLIK